jgi:peptidoglycan/xylan/chitin deacetylase (PgdA/CDA1 family)
MRPMGAADGSGSPLLLCYHGISETWPAPLAVTPDQLREHLASLKRRGYTGATFHEAVANGSRGLVAITFDDALRSVIELALPELEAAGFPATVFAPTAFVGDHGPVAWPGVDHWLDTPYRDELTPMSWEELGTLADRGWEIGSHTCTHPRLTTLDQADLDDEVHGSRAELERRLGRTCRSIAYPYGDHDAKVVAAARRAGYTAGGTLPDRLLDAGDALAAPRLGIYRADSRSRFRLKTSPAVVRARASRIWDAVAFVKRAR